MDAGLQQAWWTELRKTHLNKQVNVFRRSSPYASGIVVAIIKGEKRFRIDVKLDIYGTESWYVEFTSGWNDNEICWVSGSGSWFLAKTTDGEFSFQTSEHRDYLPTMNDNAARAKGVAHSAKGAAPKLKLVDLSQRKGVAPSLSKIVP
jgi:hypothetical protein